MSKYFNEVFPKSILQYICYYCKKNTILIFPKLKKVIITQRIDYIDRYDEIRYSIDQALLEWLIQAKFLPIQIPNKLDPLQNFDPKNKQSLFDNWLSIINPDAFVLSGGNYIGKYPIRDET